MTSKELKQISDVTITQKGDDFIKDQAMMQIMMEQLADQRREIDRLNEVALKKSIEFENMKMKLDTSNMHLFNMLDELEGAFDSDEKFASCEICLQYIDAAAYCQKYFERKHNRVREAEEWYNNLDAWEQTDKIK